MEYFTSNPTRLDRCLLGISLPMRKMDFIGDLHPDNPKDYAKSRKRLFSGYNDDFLWENDHEGIVRLIEKVCDNVQKLGVDVVYDFSLKDVHRIEGYEVATIVGHWVESVNGVELYDGVYSPDEFINEIPRDGNYILNLSICHSTVLQDKIKRTLNNIIVHGNKETISLEISLLIFQYVMRTLYSNKKQNYLDAYSQVIKELFYKL